jgi:MFS family permease
MIAVALTTLRREFSVDVATVTWVITVFYLTSAVLQPLMGRLADRYGAHRVFTFGMIIVAIAGAAGPFAPSLEWVCVARVVLAVGTAAAFPSAAALLRSLAPRGGFDAARVIGRIQLIDTSTAAIGPVVGGALILVAGWEAVFWINVPLALLAIVSTRILIPRDEPRDHVPIRRTLSESDIPGLLAFAATVVAMLMFLLALPTAPEWLLLAAAVVACALFVWRELRARVPFVDLRLLAENLPLVRVYVLFVIGNIVLYGTLFGIPQYLEEYASYSTAIVGAMLVPLAAFNAVLARPIERLIDRWGVRRTMLAGAGGLVVATAALPLLALSSQWWIVLLLMAAVGIPYAFVLISLTQSLYRTAPPAIVGQAAGLFQTARSIGCISAAAVVGLSFSGAVGAEDWLVLSLVVAGAAIALTVAMAATGRAASAGAAAS